MKKFDKEENPWHLVEVESEMITLLPNLKEHIYHIILNQAKSNLDSLNKNSSLSLVDDKYFKMVEISH